MDKPELTQGRIIGAFAIAIIADLIQFPITAIEATGLFTIPGELADFVVDCFVMGATTVLLGFHWMLLPSLLVEIVPATEETTGAAVATSCRRECSGNENHP